MMQLEKIKKNLQELQGKKIFIEYNLGRNKKKNYMIIFLR